MTKVPITGLLIAGLFVTPLGLLAKGSSGGHASAHSTSHTSSSTSHSTTHSTSKPASRPSWSGSSNYGSGKGTQAGTKPLKSKTPIPQPHTYKGTKYNSSDAIYTNKRGNWVYYWTPIVGTNSVACYDKDHKRIDCDRDKKSYAKDW